MLAEVCMVWHQIVACACQLPATRMCVLIPVRVAPLQDLTNRYKVDDYMNKKGLPKLRQFRWAAALRCQVMRSHA